MDLPPYVRSPNAVGRIQVCLRGGEVVSKLEEIGTRISYTIVTRGTKVTETFRETAGNIATWNRLFEDHADLIMPGRSAA